MKRLLSACIAALTLCAGAAAEAPQAGNVYRVKNAGYGTYLTDRGPITTPSCATLAAEGNSQLWLLETADDTGALTMRSLGSSYYLSSSNVNSAAWSLTESTAEGNTSFNVTASGDNFVFRATNTSHNYHYAHCDGSSNLVCWEPGTVNSQWVFEQADMTEAEIADVLSRLQQLLDEVANAPTYQAHLDALFADKACTTLKVSGDLTANADWQALPEALRQMALKAQSGDWAESEGDWDSDHALKYRVQLYEPYSEGSAAAGLAGIQAYTNMNNPTGILADAMQAMYVMVGDEVPDGATLHILGVDDTGMHNNVPEGYALHSGLNVIPSYANGAHLFVYYTVNTVADGKHTEHKVTEFPPLKIHIEGGRLNGFFNSIGDELYTPDVRADYDYTSARASHPMYDLIGRYVILHFHKDNVGNDKGVISSLDPAVNPGDNKEHDPVKIIKAWDDMCFAERILMGIQSDEDVASPYNRGMYSSLTGDDIADPGFQYSDYFNNRMMGISIPSVGYMNATSWRTAYNPSTIEPVLTGLPYGNLWGPAHEYGHMNQQPMKMAGTTEESNNIFSNVALFFSPYGTTSRCDYPSRQLEIFNNGGTYLEHDTWGTTRMFWQLWCYYHATGHNTKFYPRLYELLRRDPLERSYYLNPRTDMLKFAVKCCIAAQEDLTNFFTAWGFFVPLDNYHIGDYSNFMATLTQEDIDAVKAEIAALNLPVNDAIILIDDRPGSTKTTHPDFRIENAGIYGGLDSFTAGSEATASGAVAAEMDADGNLAFSVPDGADAGIGFLLYDADGTIIGFSNSNSMPLSAEARRAVLNGSATLVAANADPAGTPLPIAPQISIESRRGLLNGLITKANATIAAVDSTETRFAMFRPGYTDALRQALAAAFAANADTEATDDEIAAAYDNLLAARDALLANRYARVPALPGAKYRITSRAAYNSKTWALAADAARSILMLQESDPDNQAQLWTLEQVSELYGTYYLRNAATGQYISCNQNGNKVITTSASANHDNIYELRPTDTPPYLGILRYRSTGASLNISGNSATGNISTWGWGDTNSQWAVTLGEPAVEANARFNLPELLERADALLLTAGTVPATGSSPVALTADSFYSNAPHTGNGGDKFTTWDVLIDDNTATYFHSSWAGTQESADGLDHYIRIEAPEGETFRNFTLTYTTRNHYGTASQITGYTIAVSADGTEWTDVCSASGSDLGGQNVTHTTPEIIAPKGTRYVRFMVTSTADTAADKVHRCFAISALSMTNRAEDYVTELPEGLVGLDTSLITALCDAAVQGRMALGNANASAETLTAAVADLTQAIEALEAAIPSEMRSSLLALCDEARALLTDAGELQPLAGTDRLPLDDRRFFSNAKCQDDQWGDRFTSFSVINDSDPSTFFHSDYSLQAPDEDHHLGADFGDENATDCLQLYYHNRVTTGNAQVEYINSFELQGSNDGTDYATVLAVSTGLPTASGAQYTSPVVTADKPYRYWRMVVTAAQNRSNNHARFVVAEFGFIPVQWNAVPATSTYPDVTPAHMLDLRNAVTPAAYTAENPAASFVQLSDSHAALSAKVDALRSAMQNMHDPSGVREINAGSEKANVIYDLQGRRLAAPVRGINVINGRKVLVR